MLRVLVLILTMVAAAQAQVTTPDRSLLEQIIPDSFKLAASATIAQIGFGFWRTTVNYSLQNNSGMNLYMGMTEGSASLGSCTSVEDQRGGLPALPGVSGYSPVGPGQAAGIFVASGGRVAGAIVLFDCKAPNPGFPTAPFAMLLRASKTGAWKSMVEFPVVGDIAVRLAPSQ